MLLASICVSLLAQSRISKFYDSSVRLAQNLIEAEEFAKRIGKELETLEGKEVDEIDLNQLERQKRETNLFFVERLRDLKIANSLNENQIKEMNTSEVFALVLFLLGIASVTINLYLGSIES
jgi:hypothetical protein